MPASLSDYIRSHWDDSVRGGGLKEDIGKIPFAHTTPCITGNYVAFFYWDTYFTNLGLLRQGRTDLARSNCEAMAWLIAQKGFIPNSTFPRDDTRSQPPYFSMMVRDVYTITRDKEWLARMVAALETEYAFWQAKRTITLGLSRHFHHADESYLIRFLEGLCKRRLPLDFSTLSEIEKVTLGSHYLAEAETGWDFTPRYDGRCGDFVQVELNSLLTINESNFAWFYIELGYAGADSWLSKAEQRKALINQYLWNEERGLYLDYDYVNGRPGNVASLGTFHPLWAGIASPEQAEKVHQQLPLFEREFGVTVCEEFSRGPIYWQWGYPNGWPPLFEITVGGLLRYGFEDDAQRIARKYCALVEGHYARTGQLWEKFDMISGGLAGGEYQAQPMLGWSAGVYLSLKERLSNG